MSVSIETWIKALHHTQPEAQFVSLEPEDGTNALLAAVWPLSGTDRFQAVSYANHAFGKAELAIEVAANSTEEAAEWALAMLEFIDDHRATTDLVPGAMFMASKPHVDFAPADAWVIGLARQIELADATGPHLSLYPIFQGEIEVLRRVGLSAFLKKLGPEVTNPHRVPETINPQP